MAPEDKVAAARVAAVPVVTLPKASPFIVSSAQSSGYEYLNLLVYGDFGVGKTQLAASAQDVAEMRNVLFIDVESGGRTIEGRADIDVVRVEEFSQFARVAEYLRAHCVARDAKDQVKLKKLETTVRGVELPGPAKEYHTVVVDSLTEVQKYCMYQLLGVKVGECALDVGPESPQYAEWNKSTEMIRLLVRTFRNLRMHTIFVCSRSEDQDERKQYFYTPALPGKLSNEVQGFFDAVGYYVSGVATEGTTIQRRIFLSPGRNFKAKNRFAKWQGTYVDNPTMSDLYKIANLR